MNAIEIHNLTKDYGRQKGIFDVSFQVKQGEVFGFLGPNGAGKTTTIRHLLGFIRPQKGQCHINGLDCWKQASEIEQTLGYLPGEIAFPDNMTGFQFICFIASMRGLKNHERIEELTSYFELDAQGKLKKMSKGMKQKIGIICAFMHDPEILILDEPTSGLDPLMQNKFVELILKEKKKGKTILMSSHMFEEVERTCDRIGIIRAGHVISIEEAAALKAEKQKKFIITLKDTLSAGSFSKEPLNIIDTDGCQVTVSVKGDIMPLIQTLNQYEIENIDIVTQSLEEIFMHFYGGEKNDK